MIVRVKLVVAFAVLLFASAVHADEVPTNLGVVYIPNGSVVTSIGQVIFEGIPCPVVSFTFADGTGVAEDQGPMGAIGSLAFTTPVVGLSYDWYAPGYWGSSDNLGDTYFTPNDYDASTGTVAFAGPGITSVEWDAPNNFGLVGIESMTYTLDGPPSVPEPSSILLSGVGLVALIGLARRKRATGEKAIGWALIHPEPDSVN
jgi:hypothetical protein